MDTLNPFVPSEVCLKCDGCCRFKEEQSEWRPRMSSKESAQVRQKGLAQEIFGSDILDDKNFVKTVPGCGEHLCRFFNPINHACAIYQARPFECQLYPFVLSKNARGLGVYIHLNCPYVQQQYRSPQMQIYVDYLKVFLKSPQPRSWIGDNLSVLHDYSAYQDELELLFLLEDNP